MSDELKNENVLPENDDNDKTEEELIAESDKDFDDKNRAMRKMLKSARDMIQMFETTWNTTKNEWKLTDDLMKQVYDFNEQHRDPIPEGLSEEEKDKFDHFNGIDKMTKEDIIKIFGEQHPIILHLDYAATIARIKEAVSDFFNWLSSMQKYREIEFEYLQFIELNENKQIEILKWRAEKESDPVAKQNMLDSINEMIENKKLSFLKDITNVDIDGIIKVYGDERKIDYYIKRSRDKLQIMGISTMIIPELSKFESRYLPEKYHKINNILLLYFLRSVTYVNISNKNDPAISRVFNMVFSLDAYVKGVLNKEIKDAITENIIAYEELLYDKVVETYGDRLNN